MIFPDSGLRSDLRASRALWLIPPALLLLNLGGFPLFDVDEGAFAGATREMLASGNWLSTTLNGAPRFDKPILIYWLQAACVSLFGFSEWAVRLPSALAAIGWCWLVGRFAHERLPAGTAGVALLVAGTSIGVLAIGRAATADALLNLLLTAACLDGFRFLADDDRRALRRAYAWVGLGLLAKGPIAILIPGAALGLFAVSGGRLRLLVRGALDPLGWAILLAIALPWYIAALTIHGQAFIDGFFIKHHVERMAEPLHGHRSVFVYTAVTALVLVLPWTPALFGAAASMREDFKDPLKRFLWLWFLFVLLFFSVVQTKLPHYVLYGSTPLFLLIAMQARAWDGGTRVQRLLLVAAPLVLLCAVPVLPAVAAKVAPTLSRVHEAATLARAEAVAQAQQFVALGVALAAIGFALAFVLRHRALLAAAALSTLLAVNLATLVVGYAGELMQGPTKRAAEFARSRSEPIVLWHFPAPSFSAYLGRPTPVRTPRPGEVALRRLGQNDPPLPVDVLYREGGVELVKVRTQ